MLSSHLQTLEAASSEEFTENQTITFDQSSAAAVSAGSMDESWRVRIRQSIKEGSELLPISGPKVKERGKGSEGERGQA